MQDPVTEDLPDFGDAAEEETAQASSSSAAAADKPSDPAAAGHGMTAAAPEVEGPPKHDAMTVCGVPAYIMTVQKDQLGKYLLLDSGATECIGSAQAMEELYRIRRGAGIEMRSGVPTTFRFGNGDEATTTLIADVWVRLRNRNVKISDHVLDTKNRVPILGRSKLLKEWQAEMDFGKQQLRLFGERVPVVVTPGGHWMVNIQDYEDINEETVGVPDSGITEFADYVTKSTRRVRKYRVTH
jgi:hypothetical protein